MRLDIISPEKKLYSGEAELVTLPGINGSFSLLDRHAPVISALVGGKLVYRAEGKDVELTISGGFIEMNHNVVTVCVE
ncbi:F0F1 ATP synthase subunit epsilon [Bacteroidales bacterium OttesenSCG-928-L03]|nr:F0F1 ATP synthase subunit epsilon [Bacteroidales bacterium OttesenSCG-928-L03]